MTEKQMRWHYLTIIFGIDIGLFFLYLIKSWIWEDLFIYLHEHTGKLGNFVIIVAIIIWAVMKYWGYSEGYEEPTEPTLVTEADQIMKGE
jgi:hypothetical protein